MSVNSSIDEKIKEFTDLYNDYPFELVNAAAVKQLIYAVCELNAKLQSKDLSKGQFDIAEFNFILRNIKDDIKLKKDWFYQFYCIKFWFQFGKFK